MISKTTKEFQDKVLNKMTFSPYQMENHILYKNIDNPKLGYFIKYSRKDFYDFEIGDYTINSNFSLSFNHKEELIRFGTIYTGKTNFKIENNRLSSFSPSSFFVVEKDLKGEQTWKKGQHFHGVEIRIYKKYFEEIVKPCFPQIMDLDNFIINHTYNYLPLKIASIIQTLRSLAETNQLTPLYLESKILESIALLHSEICYSPKNSFSNQLNYGDIKIGKHRRTTLSVYDAKAIQKAHDILTDNPFNPPTIKNLSKIVLLNEQKLKAGFLAKYHMSIGQYTISIKMTMAENLLSTTELSIDEISKTLGYNHSGNFIKMFKKVHGRTPLSFRKNKN